jgi:hypothetical protein
MDNNITNIIAILTVVVVVIAVVNFSVTIIKIANFNEAMTGYASSTGYVNITVSQNIVINVSRWQIDWGAGTINTTSGCQNATLFTQGDSDPFVECGNFTRTGGPKGIIIQNLGSVNFSLNVSSNQNASNFFAGTRPAYEWNFSQKKIGTCNPVNNGSAVPSPSLSYFFNLNKSVEYNVCRQFGYLVNNEMYMDVYLRIPNDNNITDGVMRRDTITLSATAAV